MFKTKKNESKKLHLIFLASIKRTMFLAALFIFTLILLFILETVMGSKEELYKDRVIQPTFSQQKDATYSTPKPLEGFIERENFKLRQFKLNKPFLQSLGTKIEYPIELTSLGQTELTPLSCTQTYLRDPEEGTYLTLKDAGGKFSLTNPELLNYKDSLRKKYTPKLLMSISACKMEGKTFVIYGISGGQPSLGYSGKPYLGIDTGTGINEVITDIGSGGCKILQMIRNEFLYIKCSDHEGGGGFDMINQVNLNNKSVTQLLYCLNELGNVSCR